MKVIKTENYEEMSLQAAAIIAQLVKDKPDCVLGLATGSTPIGAYKELIRKHREEGLDFSKVQSVNLDEYAGLSPENEQSYRYFMRSNLFDAINIVPENTHVPCGLAEDLDAECLRYEELIAALGGTDIQVLGIGRNGHIGFNEPAEEFIVSTHVTGLDESTIDANKRFFASEDEVPRRALTMGIGAIMSAKTVLLLASGSDKAQAIKDTVTGEVTPRVQASILRFHPNVIVIADKAALSLI